VDVRGVVALRLRAQRVEEDVGGGCGGGGGGGWSEVGVGGMVGSGCGWEWGVRGLLTTVGSLRPQVTGVAPSTAVCPCQSSTRVLHPCTPHSCSEVRGVVVSDCDVCVIERDSD
jgi:hypothetical protein